MLIKIGLLKVIMAKMAEIHKNMTIMMTIFLFFSLNDDDVKHWVIFSNGFANGSP